MNCFLKLRPYKTVFLAKGTNGVMKKHLANLLSANIYGYPLYLCMSDSHANCFPYGQHFAAPYARLLLRQHAQSYRIDASTG